MLTNQAKITFTDPHTREKSLKIFPGQFAVGDNELTLVTTLGSCIAACIYDPVLKIGGMNHFMLPESTNGGDWAGVSSSARYGNYAMEHLINELLKAGASKHNLQAKIFGGGEMFASSEKIGDQNAAFAREYLQTEGIKLLAEDVGGGFARKVYFNPTTGNVTVRRTSVEQNEAVKAFEQAYSDQLSHTPVESDIELF